MHIKEFHLRIDGDNSTRELKYYGNENIIIKFSSPNIDEVEKTITFPRNVLEKFIEMINQL